MTQPQLIGMMKRVAGVPDVDALIRELRDRLNAIETQVQRTHEEQVRLLNDILNSRYGVDDERR